VRKKEKEFSVSEATNRELERKLKDLEERYALNVEASLHRAMVLPTVHIYCNFAEKKSQTDSNSGLESLYKIIEPLRCELSGEPVYDFI